MSSIAAYLFFAGQCEEAFTLYAEVLGAEIGERHTYGGSPMADQMPAEFADKLMHMELRLAGQSLMGSDTATPQPVRPMVGARVAVTLDKAVAAHTAFARLAEGGEVLMPIQPTFWSPAFGMLTDRFGVSWLVSGAE